MGEAMILRRTDFGKVLSASAARGFFGKGYWFHHLPFGPNFHNSTLAAKTTTLEKCQGSMPLNKGKIKPVKKEWQVRNQIEGIVPFMAGQPLQWQLAP